MTFIIHTSKNGQSVATVRISPAVAVDTASVGGVGVASSRHRFSRLPVQSVGLQSAFVTCPRDGVAPKSIPTVVPEPSTWPMLLFGLAQASAFGSYRRLANRRSRRRNVGIARLNFYVRSPFPKKSGVNVAKKTKKLVRREWTKADLKTLKSMARKTPVAKIAKALKRTQGATAAKAHILGISLDTRG